VLGRGGFKTVYKAYDSLEGCEVAWNVVRLLGVPEDEKKRIINEVNLLYTLKHPNILEFRGTWVKSRDEIIFITEILAAGSLKQFIKKVRYMYMLVFPCNHAISLFLQLLLFVVNEFII
jgi:WNK lysine deficient protein kinase